MPWLLAALEVPRLLAALCWVRCDASTRDIYTAEGYFEHGTGAAGRAAGARGGPAGPAALMDVAALPCPNFLLLPGPAALLGAASAAPPAGEQEQSGRGVVSSALPRVLCCDDDVVAAGAGAAAGGGGCEGGGSGSAIPAAPASPTGSAPLPPFVPRPRPLSQRVT